MNKSLIFKDINVILQTLLFIEFIKLTTYSFQFKNIFYNNLNLELKSNYYICIFFNKLFILNFLLTIYKNQIKLI